MCRAQHVMLPGERPRNPGAPGHIARMRCKAIKLTLSASYAPDSRMERCVPDSVDGPVLWRQGISPRLQLSEEHISVLHSAKNVLHAPTVLLIRPCVLQVWRHHCCPAWATQLPCLGHTAALLGPCVCVETAHVPKSSLSTTAVPGTFVARDSCSTSRDPLA